MAHRTTRRWGAALAAVLLVAACGSDDDEAGANDEASVEEESTTDSEPADDPTESADEPEPSDEAAASGDDSPAPDEEDVDDNGDDDKIVIDDFDDIPDECVDLMAEFLRSIEDNVSGIDWETATIEDIEAMGDVLDVPTEDFDARMSQTGCDRYDIGVDDDQGLAFAIRIAEREAPGAVGWLEFIASFTGLGDTNADGEGSSAGAGDLPTDCEGTKNYLLDKAEEYGTIEAVPVNEFMTLSTAITNLTSQCTLEDVGAFYENPTITAFLDG